MTTTRPSPARIERTTTFEGTIGVKPAKITKVARASASAAPTAMGPNRRLFQPAQAPQIEVADLLAERIAIKAQDFRGLDLVAPRRR